MRVWKVYRFRWQLRGAAELSSRLDFHREQKCRIVYIFEDAAHPCLASYVRRNNVRRGKNVTANKYTVGCRLWWYFFLPLSFYIFYFFFKRYTRLLAMCICIRCSYETSWNARLLSFSLLRCSSLHFFLFSFSFSKEICGGKRVSGLSLYVRTHHCRARVYNRINKTVYSMGRRVIIAARNLVCFCMTKERIDKRADALVVTIGGGWVTPAHKRTVNKRDERRERERECSVN